MTDNQGDRLDVIIDKLDKASDTLAKTSESLSRGLLVTFAATPPERLEQIIKTLAPMAENIQAIRQQLADMEQVKTSPEPPLAPPKQT
ncbi:MAG TPA: hypothetical protein VMT20_28740 [Terriglobia bacterium]|nr:hypothetical protein [Terriglobia bacterium]